MTMKLSRERSITRPVMNGPRSLTRQTTLSPLSLRVTLTMVPNGSVRWAQVPGGAPNHDALPLSALPSDVRCTAGTSTEGSVEVGGAAWIMVLRVSIGAGGEVATGATGGAGATGWRTDVRTLAEMVVVVVVVVLVGEVVVEETCGTGTDVDTAGATTASACPVTAEPATANASEASPELVRFVSAATRSSGWSTGPGANCRYDSAVTSNMPTAAAR